MAHHIWDLTTDTVAATPPAAGDTATVLTEDRIINTRVTRAEQRPDGGYSVTVTITD